MIQSWVMVIALSGWLGLWRWRRNPASHVESTPREAGTDYADTDNAMAYRPPYMGARDNV